MTSASPDVQQTIARAGHDLNNACASLLGFSALALETLAQDSPVRGYFAEIEAAATRAARIAEELLALSIRLSTPPSR